MVRIKELESLLMKIFLVKGRIIKRYVLCSKKNCKCREGELHGPYYYLSCRDKGKIVQIYIPKDSLKEVEEGIRNYKGLEEVVANISEGNIKKIKGWKDEGGKGRR